MANMGGRKWGDFQTRDQIDSSALGRTGRGRVKNRNSTLDIKENHDFYNISLPNKYSNKLGGRESLSFCRDLKLWYLHSNKLLWE